MTKWQARKLITSLLRAVRGIVLCLSVHSHNSKTTWLNFAKCLCMLPVAVVQSYSDGIAISYVFPFFWMMSCFHAMGPVGKNQAWHHVWKKLPVGCQDSYSVCLSWSECGSDHRQSLCHVSCAPTHSTVNNLLEMFCWSCCNGIALWQI